MRDPVCGMKVGPGALQADGYPDFRFCSEHCRRRFLADPERYGGAPASDGGGELRVGRLFGIPLRLHWSFLLFVGWLVFDGLRYGPAGMLDAIGWTSMLFGSVLIHELAHALVGRARGVAVEDIILLPIGGATRLTKLGDGGRGEPAK